MKAPEQVDAVIVGARVAGAATAVLLARRGHRVLVLDRAQPGSDTLSTHAFMRGGVVQLNRWGLLDQIVAAGTPPIRRTTFHYDDPDAGSQTVAIDITASAGVDALYAPRRTLLDQVLADAAEAAGADVWYGVNVTGLERAMDGRVVGVFGRDRRGDAVHVRAGITIGADGVRSIVAREAGAAQLRAGSGTSGVVYGHWAGLDVDGYEWFYGPDVAAGFVPTNNGEVCVFAAAPASRFQHEVAGDVRAGYLRLLAKATGDDRLRAANAPRRLWAHPGRAAHIRQAWGIGWALVGDAGHFVDPLSAHGMTDALRDAELLAGAVSELLDGADEAGSLAAYQSARDRIAGPLFGPIDELSTYRWTIPRVREILLSLNEAMRGEVRALTELPAPVRGRTPWQAGTARSD
jgi:flavin-dependent dehydrogenase